MLRRALAFALPFAVVLAWLSPSAIAGEDRHAALVLDANTGAVLHDADGDSLRHPASLTKMMTLYLTFEMLTTGRLAISDRVTISENAASVAPSKLDLDAGEDISVSDAVKALITKSANDIAVALAEKIGGSEANFVGLMNTRARELGMARTHFENASGLPNDDQVTTARDMATLALHLQDDFPAYYPLFATRTFSYGGKTFRNHNTMLDSFAGIDGIKTGYTRASGFNLVTSLHRNGRHLVGVVFGGDSAASRNGEMRVLLTKMLTRASAIKTRKPMLLARLKAEPKLAQRPAAASRPNVKVAAASPSPKAFAKPFSDAERINALAEAPEPQTPVQIFKVRAVPIVPKARRPAPSPDETTDMEASEQPTDLHAQKNPLAGDSSSRSDFGRFAAGPDPTLASKIGERFSVANAATRDQTVITKTGADASSSHPGQISMLGAAAALTPTPVASRATPVVQPVSFVEPDEVKRSDAASISRSVSEATAEAKDAVAGKITRGLPPSTLGAQANALAGSKAPRPSTFALRDAATGRYEVQIGAYGSIDEAQRALAGVQARSGKLLAGVASVTHPTVKDGHQIFRARFTGLDADRAAATCTALRRQSVDCLVTAAQ